MLNALVNTHRVYTQQPLSHSTSHAGRLKTRRLMRSCKRGLVHNLRHALRVRISNHENARYARLHVLVDFDFGILVFGQFQSDLNRKVRRNFG